MPRTREEILEHRRRLRAEYGALFDSMAALLFRRDTKGVNCDDSEGLSFVQSRVRSSRRFLLPLRALHSEWQLENATLPPIPATRMPATTLEGVPVL
jgi:hypothetical protein